MCTGYKSEDQAHKSTKRATPLLPMQIMRQRNPVIEKMVHSHLVLFEDLNKKTMLVIQVIVSEKAKSLCFCLRQKETVTVEKEETHDKSLLARSTCRMCCRGTEASHGGI